MRDPYKTLTHPKIGILIMKSYKTNLVFISQLHTYYLITVGGICNKITAVFWADHSVYNFFTVVYKIMQLDYLAIE